MPEQDYKFEISVIIPVYNGRDTIMRAVNSVLAQSYQDFELLIIDDCSSDNPQDLLSELDDKRICYIRHEKNKGAASARNTGIMNAKGKYVAFLDADDLWSKDKLQKQYDFLESASPQTKAICTSFEMVRNNGNIGKRLLSKKKNWQEELIGGCGVSPGSTLMAVRAVFFDDDVGLYPEDMRRLEDWDWLLNYIYKYDLEVLEDYTAQIWVSGYPKYKVVCESSRVLFYKQKHKIIKNFGACHLGRFKAGIEIEKGGAAFSKGLYAHAFYHALKAFIFSPDRVLKLLKRLWHKLRHQDYGNLKNAVK